MTAQNLQNKTCNISVDGCTEFIPTLEGRLSSTKLPPKCKKCGSLERHRSIRKFFVILQELINFNKCSCLQISSDLSVKPEWFLSHELSVYGSQNSIDIQNIQKPSEIYDLVLCNHVLEHVENDIKALNELIRILKPDGLLELSVPSPLWRKTTNDWGYPDQQQHGHYRIYGSDIEQKFRNQLSCHYISCTIFDPVTNEKDLVYLFVKSEHQIEEIYNFLKAHQMPVNIWLSK